jgi:hypothetical protein
MKCPFSGNWASAIQFVNVGRRALARQLDRKPSNALLSSVSRHLRGAGALNREFAVAGLAISVDRNFGSKPTKPVLHRGHSHPSFAVSARPGANLPEKRSVWRCVPFAEFVFGMSLIAGIAVAFNIWLSR